MEVDIGLADNAEVIAIGRVKDISSCHYTCVSTDLLQKALNLMKKDMKREYVFLIVDKQKDGESQPLLMTGDKDNDTGIVIAPYIPREK